MAGDCTKGNGRFLVHATTFERFALDLTFVRSHCRADENLLVVYEGGFRDGLPHGKGRFGPVSCPSCEFTPCFEGEFDAGRPVRGRATGANGDVYEGEFDGQQASGAGKAITYAADFEGEFRAGDPVEGTLFAKAGSKIAEGRFEFDLNDRLGRLKEGWIWLNPPATASEDIQPIHFIGVMGEPGKPHVGRFEAGEFGSVEIDRTRVPPVIGIKLGRSPYARWLDRNASRELILLSQLASWLPEGCLVGDCVGGDGIFRLPDQGLERIVRPRLATDATYAEGVSADHHYTRGQVENGKLNGPALRISLRTGTRTQPVFVDGFSADLAPPVQVSTNDAQPQQGTAPAERASPPESGASPERVAMRAKNQQAMDAAVDALTRLRKLQVGLGGPRGVLGATLANLVPEASSIQAQFGVASSGWYALSQGARSVSDAEEYASSFLALHRCHDRAQGLVGTMIDKMHAAGQARDERAVLGYAVVVEDLIKEIARATGGCTASLAEVATF